MENTYVPYATRENVQDEKLHPILNYIERVLAWDIKFQYTDTDNWIIGKQDYKGIIVCSNGSCSINMQSSGNLYTIVPQEVLLEVYQAILPVIRDKSK